MSILTSVTEFSFAPRNISVWCSIGLVWVGVPSAHFPAAPRDDRIAYH